MSYTWELGLVSERYDILDDTRYDLVGDVQAELDDWPRKNHTQLQRKLKQASG
jgi:hypothetical protein